MKSKDWEYCDCPICGIVDAVEVFDDINSKKYIERCQECNYVMDKRYYDLGEGYILLMHVNEAIEKGLSCRDCKEDLTAEWEKEAGICAGCIQEGVEIKTEEEMKNEAIAKVCHEVNRAYCKALGDESQLPFWGKVLNGDIFE